MQDDADFDYVEELTSRRFDAETRQLIVRILQDQRFEPGPKGRAVVREFARHLGGNELRAIAAAASEVFEVAEAISSMSRWEDDEAERAAQRKQVSKFAKRVLEDPDFDPLPPWSGEDPADDYFARAFPELSQETRARIEFRVLSDGRAAEAVGEVERFAARVAGDLPQTLVDKLVLSTRNAHRESLLRDQIGAVSARRLGWTAYHIQRVVKANAEEAVLDRYSAAAKTLNAYGWRKKDIAVALGVSAARVDRLLERATWQRLDATDPLLDAAPELRKTLEEAGEPLGGYVGPPAKRKALSRMNVAERVVLAQETDDPAILARLSKQGSPRISEALIERHVQAGDLSDDVLHAVLKSDSREWVRHEIALATPARPLPTRAALELATTEPWTLIEASSETLKEAAASGDERYLAVVALKNEDIDQLQQFLRHGEDSPAFQVLLELFDDRPLSDALKHDQPFIDALLAASERAIDRVVAASLRLVACQNRAVFEQHVHAGGATGPLDIHAADLAHAAMRPGRLSREADQRPLREVAMTLWGSADITTEHALARAVVNDKGRETVTIRTRHATFVATADAIRKYPNDDSTEYTYVRLYLRKMGYNMDGPALVQDFRAPHLGYRRESGKHPSNPDGDDIEVIVWPLPLQPAIYCFDIAVGTRYIAVSAEQVAVLKEPD